MTEEVTRECKDATKRKLEQCVRLLRIAVEGMEKSVADIESDGWPYDDFLISMMLAETLARDAARSCADVRIECRDLLSTLDWMRGRVREEVESGRLNPETVLSSRLDMEGVEVKVSK